MKTINRDIRLLRGQEVLSLLGGCELELVDIVKCAYEAHARGHSSLPESTFLHFPEQPQNRIIALPGYLGDEFRVAGLKWIASFPKNSERGEDRASAVIILNSEATGQPIAILEGSVISAKRTAASAALALQHMHQRLDAPRLGLVGCGLINFEIVRFLKAIYPSIEYAALYDTSAEHAKRFQQKCTALRPELDIEITRDLETLFARSSVISFATTAASPHVYDLSHCQAGTTILNISLRDLAPQLILDNDNVVDDIDHVCRADTSIHLAERQTQSRRFIRCTLADITSGAARARALSDRPTIFSPFGLGILDIAAGAFTLSLAEKHEVGTRLESFLPTTWIDR